jgi:hypothetical protein
MIEPNTTKTIRVWKEGGRVFEGEAICVETDGDEIEIFGVGEGEQYSFQSDEWDELTVG